MWDGEYIRSRRPSTSLRYAQDERVASPVRAERNP